MPCNCSKNRSAAKGVAQISGTHRVMVNGRQVYETTSADAAATVAARFKDARVLTPGEAA